jgi:type I restriction-modification system DNA methylase subunit
MADHRGLDISALENWLWEAACVIRGPVDAPKYKDYILPLIFLKRLSDVFDDELTELGATAKFVDRLSASMFPSTQGGRRSSKRPRASASS